MASEELDPSLAREIWLVSETLHALIYFAPEKVGEYRAAGLRGGWMGYFASRAAPMGAVSAEVVAATFYNFHPQMVARSIPDAWSFSNPERVVAARYSAAGAALARILPMDADDDVASALQVMRPVLDDLDVAGRPLAAAQSSLAWPDDVRLALWHACTVWREFRGDAHVASLVASGVGPMEAHLMLAAGGAATEDVLRENRGWSSEEWEEERRRLQAKGLLDGSGALTPTGAALREQVETSTDRLSLLPWSSVGTRGVERFLGAMSRIVAHVVAADDIPFPNPMGLAKRELMTLLGSAERA